MEILRFMGENSGRRIKNSKNINNYDFCNRMVYVNTYLEREK